MDDNLLNGANCGLCWSYEALNTENAQINLVTRHLVEHLRPSVLPA